MIEFYPQIKYLHIALVLASGVIFALRGAGVLAGMRWPHWLPVRWTSYTVDTALLTAALMLLTMLPGAMFLLGYFEDGTPVMGLPGCVMYAGATIFDLALPYIAANVEMVPADFAAMGEGGLCLGCQSCHYPICPFGK